MSESHAPKLMVSFEGDPWELAPRVLELLARAGVAGAELRPAEQAGVFFVWFPGDPRGPVDRLRALCESDPAAFHGTRQWTPIDEWTHADAAHLAAFAERLARRTPDEQPFEVEIRREGHMDLEVEALLPEQQSHPPPSARTLRIEIVGDQAGVSVLEPGDELDVTRLERAKQAHDAFSGSTRR